MVIDLPTKLTCDWHFLVLLRNPLLWCWQANHAKVMAYVNLAAAGHSMRPSNWAFDICPGCWLGLCLRQSIENFVALDLLYGNGSILPTLKRFNVESWFLLKPSSWIHRFQRFENLFGYPFCREVRHHQLLNCSQFDCLVATNLNHLNLQ